MNIPKAIEILAGYKMESAFEATPDFEGALQLGISALKVAKANRNPELPIYIGLLPGETE